MRFFVVFILAGLIASGAPLKVVAQSNGSKTDSQSAEQAVETEDEDLSGDRGAETLDGLFADLKKQTRSGAADLISKRIWNKWTDSGSKSIDLLMGRAATAMNKKKDALALDILAQVVTLKPEFAEGWNRRATLYYNMRDFGRSIADVERVLALEPRHYGALSGLAIMLKALGKDQESLDTWYKVLAIYPANKTAQKQVIELIEKMAGQKT